MPIPAEVQEHPEGTTAGPPARIASKAMTGRKAGWFRCDFRAFPDIAAA